MKEKTGKELYAWTQQRMVCLRGALRDGSLCWEQFQAERRKVDAAWADWRRRRGQDREEKKPSIRIYEPHYEKSFFIDPTKVPSR